MTKPRPSRSQQGGFAYIAAIIVLVALGGMSLAVTRLSTTQQATSAMDAQQAFALQTARAGTEWGMYMAVTGNACPADRTLDFRGLNGFAVTVMCAAVQVNEGEASAGVAQVKNVMTVTATACNSAACPNDANVARSDYVERRRVATVAVCAANKPC
jgi:MSHA biogenesis protein MshP